MQIIKENFEKIHLSSEFLEDIIEKITSAAEVKKIYIFGSYARGEERKDSDIDIYAVVPDSCVDTLETGVAIRRALFWLELPKDVLVKREKMFEADSKRFASIESDVINEGVLIYG